MRKRSRISLICYALSSFGILLMLQIIRGDVISLPSFIWIGAWAIHVIMCVSWVRNVRLPRLWPALGVVFGSASFLPWALVGPELFPGQGTATIFMRVQLIVVMPCVLLALWLIKFHWGKHPDR
jgi:hypothetical protein